MPLPPYVTKRLENKERYQTVYSEGIRKRRRTHGWSALRRIIGKAENKGNRLGFCNAACRTWYLSTYESR